MTDNKDYRLYLDSRFDGMIKLVNAQFINVHDKLESIEKQVIKTNSRVNHHDEDIAELKNGEIKHLLECPAMGKIGEIQTDLLEYKWFKQHPKLGLSIVAIAVALILFNVYGIIGERKIKTALQESAATIKNEKIRQYNDLVLTIDSLKSVLVPNK